MRPLRKKETPRHAWVYYKEGKERGRGIRVCKKDVERRTKRKWEDERVNERGEE